MNLKLELSLVFIVGLLIMNVKCFSQGPNFHILTVTLNVVEGC